MKKVKTEDKKIEDNFISLIKLIISEEDFVKHSDLKDFAKEVLENIEPIVAKVVKKHLTELAKFVIKEFDNKEEIIK